MSAVSSPLRQLSELSFIGAFLYAFLSQADHYSSLVASCSSRAVADWVITFIAPLAMYLVYGTSWMVLDLLGVCKRYKVQQQKQQGTLVNYRKAWAVAARNWVISGVYGYLLTLYVMPWRNRLAGGTGKAALTEGQGLPSFSWWFLLEMAVFVLIEELCFYYSHAAVHSKLLYSECMGEEEERVQGMDRIGGVEQDRDERSSR